MIEDLQNPKSRLLIIGPHPDDAEFSVGRLLLRREGYATVICITDGRKGHQGVADEDRFAEIRKNESRKASALLKVKDIRFWGLPDQELSQNPYVIDKLFMLFRKEVPDLILVCPWEGAHPDHDAAHLFTVMAAHNAGYRDRVFEYASYNYYGGRFNVQKFIPATAQEFVFTPTPEEQKGWLMAMSQFTSQIIQQRDYIPKSNDERFRRLPRYDYSRLPYSNREINRLITSMHDEDKMFYETWSNMDAAKFFGKLSRYPEHYGI